MCIYIYTQHQLQNHAGHRLKQGLPKLGVMQGKRLSLEELWSTGTAQDVANYLAQLEESKHEAPKSAPSHLQEMKQEANGDSKPAALDVETSKKRRTDSDHHQKEATTKDKDEVLSEDPSQEPTHQPLQPGAYHVKQSLGPMWQRSLPKKPIPPGQVHR